MRQKSQFQNQRPSYYLKEIFFLALKSSPSFLSSHIYLNHDKEKGHAELRGEQKKKSYMNIVWGLVCSEKNIYFRTTGRKMEK